MKQKHRTVSEKGLRRRILITVLLFCTVSIALVLWFLLGWRIRSVTVLGASLVQEEEILDAADIKLGRHLFALDDAKIKRAVGSISPYIRSVRVKRRLTTSVVIEITEHLPCCHAVIGDHVLLLSDAFVVLDTPDKQNIEERKETPLVILPAISDWKLGKKLVFADSRAGEKAEAAFSAFLYADLSDTLSAIDLSNRFDISASLREGYTLSLGSERNLEKKLARASDAVRYLAETQSGVFGVIYLTEEGGASFVATGVGK